MNIFKKIIKYSKELVWELMVLLNKYYAEELKKY